MNQIKQIKRINSKEIDILVNQNNVDGAASWHDEHKHSAYIYVGGLPYKATEGDVITIFSQYGEIMDINMLRDRETGKSKGGAFLKYEDQRSTILAVDNLNGIQLAGRTLKVDHVKDYKPPKKDEEKDYKPRRE